MLGRLSELMFVDVVRRYLETLPADQTGWLAGLREPFVGRALTALHGSPAHQWTLEALAREVGLSRSALAERFTQFVGHPPMQYLANWRMQLAANYLQSGTDNVAADRRARRLRVGGRVQPRVQENGGRAAEPVAQARWRRAPGVVLALVPGSRSLVLGPSFVRGPWSRPGRAGMRTMEPWTWGRTKNQGQRTWDA